MMTMTRMMICKNNGGKNNGGKNKTICIRFTESIEIKPRILNIHGNLGFYVL